MVLYEGQDHWEIGFDHMPIGVEVLNSKRVKPFRKGSVNPELVCARFESETELVLMRSHSEKWLNSRHFMGFNAPALGATSWCSTATLNRASKWYEIFEFETSNFGYGGLINDYCRLVMEWSMTGMRVFRR